MGAVIDARQWHFHRRLFQRYGIVLGPADYSRIAKTIARRRVPFIDRRPDGSAVYLVQVPSSGALVFVAAKPNGVLITALPVHPRLLGLVNLSEKMRALVIDLGGLK